MPKSRRRTQKDRCSVVSKGHAEVDDCLQKIGFTTINEFQLGPWSYDIYIEDLNILIEYNGTRWHYDMRFYVSDYFDKVKNRTAQVIWDRDEEKIQYAIDAGYQVVTIWQHDWEKCKHKQKLLRKLLASVSSKENGLPKYTTTYRREPCKTAGVAHQQQRAIG